MNIYEIRLWCGSPPLFLRSYLVSELAIFHANFPKMRFQHACQPSDEIIRRRDHVCFYVDYVRARRTIRRCKVFTKLFLPDSYDTQFYVQIFPLCNSDSDADL